MTDNYKFEIHKRQELLVIHGWSMFTITNHNDLHATWTSYVSTLTQEGVYSPLSEEGGVTIHA